MIPNTFVDPEGHALQYAPGLHAGNAQLIGVSGAGYLPLGFGRNGRSLSAREARFRDWTQTSPLPLNFITRPSPPAMSERIPPTFPMVYSTSSVNATRWPVSTTSS